MTSASTHSRALLWMMRRAQSVQYSPMHLLLMAPLVAATAYIVVFSRYARTLLRHVYWDSDVASSPLLAERLSSSVARPTGTLVVGQPGYLQLDIWTHWLPAHRLVWEWVLGPGFMVVGIALAAWAVARLSSRWAGAVAGSLMIAASPEVMYSYLSQTYHIATWASQCALFAFATWVLTRPVGGRRSSLVAASIIAALFVGYWSASDQLLFIDGVVPFALGIVVVACTRAGRARPHALAASGAVVAGSVGTMKLVSVRFATKQWVVPPAAPVPSRLATADEVTKNAGLMVQNILQVGNGDFFGQPINIRGLFLLTSALLAVTGLLAPSVLLRQQVRVDRESRSTARLFAGAYWLSLQLVLIAGYLFTEVSVNLSGWRYLVGLLPAVACTVPLWAGRRLPRRLMVAGSATIICLTATSSILHFGGDVSNDARDQNLAALLNELNVIGVQRGYGDYWDAQAVSWYDMDRVTLLPVQGAGACLGGTEMLCLFPRGATASEYAPQAGGSFYVADPAHIGPNVGLLNAQPDPARFGKPSATHTVAGMVVYVYSYDLAARFSTPLGGP